MYDNFVWYTLYINNKIFLYRDTYEISDRMELYLSFITP